MEQYFTVMFVDVRQERSLLLLISLTDPNISKKAKFSDHEIKIIKNLASEKLHRQGTVKEEVAIASLAAELD